MILERGMSEFPTPKKDHSDNTARITDEEIKAIIDAAHNDAHRRID